MNANTHQHIYANTPLHDPPISQTTRSKATTALRRAALFHFKKYHGQYGLPLYPHDEDLFKDFHLTERDTLALPLPGDPPSCRFSDWLENISFILGKYPLPRDRLHQTPFLCGHIITNFGLWNPLIPSTTGKKEALRAPIWNALMKMTALLDQLPIKDMAFLNKSYQPLNRHPVLTNQFFPVLPQMNRFLQSVKADWVLYRCYAFSP